MIAASVTDSDVPAAAEQGGQLETKRKSSEGDTLFAADSSSGSLEVRQTHLHVREHMPAVPSLPCTSGGLDLNYKVTQCQWQTRSRCGQLHVRKHLPSESG
jgi:hypothetical protein